MAKKKNNAPADEEELPDDIDDEDDEIGDDDLDGEEEKEKKPKRGPRAVATTSKHRTPRVGSKFEATYKGKAHTMTVVSDEDGTVAYKVGSRRYRSPSSAAGSIVDGPNAPNGWSFWGMEPRAGEQAAKKVRAPAKPAKRGTSKRAKKARSKK